MKIIQKVFFSLFICFFIFSGGTGITANSLEIEEYGEELPLVTQTEEHGFDEGLSQDPYVEPENGAENTADGFDTERSDSYIGETNEETSTGAEDSFDFQETQEDGSEQSPAEEQVITALEEKAPEGEAPEGEAPEGETPEEKAPEEETLEEETPEGETPEEKAPEGETPEEKAAEGEAPEGETPEEEALEAYTPEREELPLLFDSQAETIDEKKQETIIPKSDLNKQLIERAEDLSIAEDEESIQLEEAPETVFVVPEIFENEINDLEAYAEQVLNAKKLGSGADTRKKLKSSLSQLTPAGIAVYDVLKNKIASVAAGEASSTIFSFGIEELGLEKTSWTKEELGLDAIIEDGTIREDAKAAADRAIGINMSKIINALLADCPYELYWYDKTMSTSINGFRYSATSKTISFVGEMVVQFPVANEYAIDTYTVDTSYGEEIHRAVNNASQIVDYYSGLSDYEKMEAYCAEICSLTSYNMGAQDGEADYGNAWQIIWVFNGDSRGVVCEGYAKAFQYLCDLSAFQNPVTIRTVTGSLGNAGLHMWNIASMENGCNYLIDVTNCDTGKVGAPDYLFLAGTCGGSVESGYQFKTNTGAVIVYYYSDEARGIYGDDELTISESSYTGKYDNDPCAYDHDYELKEWIWSEDLTSASALFECKRNSEHMKYSQATIEIVQEEEKCDENGIKTCTARVNEGGQWYNDTQSIILPPLGHLYSLDQWIWEEDGSSAEALFICSHDHTHTVAIRISSAATPEPREGGILYTVILENSDSPDERSHRDDIIIAKTGWMKGNDGYWYYLKEDSSLAFGWLMVDHRWYYMNSSGVMQTGWQKINGAWYYLNPGGDMATGWKQVGSNWYYLDSNGAMATGWREINGEWYYFGSNGNLQATGK